MKKISVLIVDDHYMVRMGLAESISLTGNMVIVGEAVNGLQAIEKYRALRPNVVIMDFQMPGLNGAESTARLRGEFPEAAVILLSVFQREEDIWQAAQAGVMSYLPKSVEIQELRAVISKVAAGETCFPSSIVAQLEERRTRSDLTRREREVLQLIVAGRSNKEIATDLKVSDSLVKLYVSRLLERLGAADRTQVAVQAIERGFVTLKS